MKSRNFRALIILLLGFSLSVPLMSFALAAPKPAQTVTLTFWYTENDAEKPGLLAKVAAFEAANPDIAITAEQKGFFGVGDEFATAFAAANEPQVLRTPRDDVVRFAKDGLIMDLTAEWTYEDYNDFIDASRKLSSYDQKFWAFPQSIDCPTFVYNKEMFIEAGLSVNDYTFETSLTWAQFGTLMDTLDTALPAGEYPLSLAGLFFSAQPYYYGMGAAFVENNIFDQAHVTVDSAASKAALEYLKQVTDSSWTPPWTEQGWSYFGGDFRSGKVAMIATGPWDLTDLVESQALFNGGENLGFMQLPHDEAGDYGAIIGGQYYTISSQASDTEYTAAVKFIKFLSSADMMAQSAISNYHVPARKSVMSRTDVTNADSYPYVRAYYEQALNAFQLASSPYYGQMETAFGNKIDEYLKGDITVDTCISDTIDLWADILPATADVTSGDPPVPPAPPIPGFEIPLVLASMFIGTIGIIMLLKKKMRK